MSFINKIKKISNIFGIKINKNFKIIPLFKKNVFNKRYTKKVLISYITEPFVIDNDFSHTNLLECFTAAEIFDSLEYCVDVVNFESNKKIDYGSYDVIYGMGNPFENSFYFNKKTLKRIFYATGCNPTYSNFHTIDRVRDFNKKNNILLIDSSRFIQKSPELQVLLSDGVIVLGNKFVLETYTKYDSNNIERYKNLNAFYYNVPNIKLKEKKYDHAKKHFLWFGSTGSLHKGLDILIDFFNQRSDLTLHICGANKKETNFFKIYNKKLSESKNIIDHGFVDMRSEKFEKILSTCMFTISASVSEGGSASILNTVANGGLIPICPTSNGLDINEFGIILNSIDGSDIEIGINKALSLNLDSLKNMSDMAKNTIKEEYTIEKYKNALKKIIKEYL